MDVGEVYTVYAVGLPVVALMIAAEAVYSARNRLGLYEAADAMGSVAMFLGNVLVNGAIGGLVLLVHVAVYEIRLWDLSSTLPAWLVWVLAFVAIDFVFYWFHRASHRTNLLWAIHLSHHCSTRMNFLVALRQPWLAPLAKVPWFAVLPWVGFDPTIVLVAGAISTLWGVVGHTQVIPRLPEPIEWVFNTPSAHRVHHGSNPKYLDKNYGNLLMVWDHVFGTYQREEDAVVYGLTRNVETQNPVVLTVGPYRDLFERLASARSIRERASLFVRPPG